MSAQPKELLLTPFAGNPSFPLLRAHMMVSEADMRNYDALPRGRSNHTVQVFDTVSGEYHLLRRDDCGLGCFCAAEIVTPASA